jgi:wobble nucleotide-excising tRNase
MALNSATSMYRFLEMSAMHKEQQEVKKVDLNRRELDDKACPFCGAQTHTLVLRWDMESQADRLFTRCARCQRLL